MLDKFVLLLYVLDYMSHLLYSVNKKVDQYVLYYERNDMPTIFVCTIIYHDGRRLTYVFCRLTVSLHIGWPVFCHLLSLSSLSM